jgi:hypothetical protein
MDDLHPREAEIARLTAAENPDEMMVCDAAMVPFTKGFDAMAGDFRVEPVRIETVQLLAMAFNALRWSQEQLLKGYYSPAITMARTAWECWLNGAYINLYPAGLDEWKRYETRPRPWKMRELVAARSTKDEPAKAANEDSAEVTEETNSEFAEGEFLRGITNLYAGSPGQRFSGYSVLSHPSWEAIRVLVKTEGDEMSLRVGPDYDQDLFRLALDSYCTAATLTSSLFLYVMDAEKQEAFLPVIEKASEPHRVWRQRHSE